MGTLEGKQRQNRREKNIWRNNNKKFPDIELFKSWTERVHRAVNRVVKWNSTAKHNIRIIKTVNRSRAKAKSFHKEHRKNNANIKLPTLIPRV